MRRTMLRRLAGAARGACLAALLAVAGPAAARAQDLAVGVESPFGIDPHFLFLGPNMAAARHLYDTVINRDAESRFVPGIVESWRAVDPTTWELALRRGVAFHDGSAFEAADIAFSIARVPALPNNPGPYTTNLRTITAVEIVDPHTVRVRTDRPNPTLPGQLTNIFVVSHRAARGEGGAAGASTADFSSGRAAVGTGPFRLERYRGTEGMSVLRHEGYWGPAPAWRRVDLRVMGNDSSRLAALLAGDVDLIEGVPTADVARLMRDARVSVFRRNSDRVMFLIPNVAFDASPLVTDTGGQPLSQNPFRDLRVRRALSLAVDREALAARALDGQAVATIQVVPEQFGAFDPDMVPPKSADPAAARRLLAEAGYPEGIGVTLGCSNNRYVNDARVCQAIGQMLQRAGFSARVETQPGSVFFPRTQAGRNDLPLALFGLSLSSSRDASYFLSTVIHGRDPAHGFGQANRSGFADAKLDAAIREAAELGGEAREPALRAAMRAALEQVPIVPLYNAGVVTAARRGIVYEPRMDEQTVAFHARPAP